ncbi:MAG: tyrosine-type recombinase/integrase [Candidatus Zixiibacteriota bacterium]|nr:MAG: tyrosine-type recombinase/integrase [candidate division Zixibacteria bacterium]
MCRRYLSWQINKKCHPAESNCGHTDFQSVDKTAVDSQQLTNPRYTDLLQNFLQDCRFRGLSERTIEDYEYYLNRIFKRFTSDFGKNDLKAFVLSEVQRGLSPATANHYIRGVKAFFSYLVEEGLIDTNPFLKLSLVKEPQVHKPVLTPTQVGRLLAIIPEEGYFNVRDKTMIAILWDTAIRAKELFGLTLSGVDIANNTLKVNGKGNKDRVVPFGRKTKKLIIKYLKIRRDNGSPLLFCTDSGQRINHHNFQRTLYKFGKKVGLHVHPHLIRHSAATFLAKAEMPATHLQLLLGHSSLAVTQRYINQIVNQEGLQISHRRLSPGDRI